jgi:hypothetical protein
VRAVGVRQVPHPVIQRLQMLRTYTAESGSAERGEDVAVDLPAVAVPRAGGHDQPLARQPTRREIGAEAEPTQVVVAAIHLSREPGGELLRVGTLDASGMPDPPLAL